MPSHRMPGVVLPNDEVQHRCFEHEWWYFFAVLREPSGAEHHYTTALMRRGIAWVSYYRWWDAGAPALGRPESTILRKSVHRGPTGPSTTDVLVEPASNWRVRLGAGRSTHRLGTVADLHFADDDVGAFLHTRAADGGIRHYGGANEMAWYSWPRLKVTGVLRSSTLSSAAARDAARLEGFGWMEHQWGNTDFTKLSWRYVPILLDRPSRAFIAFRYQHKDASTASVEVSELVDGEARPVPGASLTPAAPGAGPTRVVVGDLELTCRPARPGIVDLGFPGVPRFAETPSLVFDASDARIGVAITEYHPVPTMEIDR